MKIFFISMYFLLFGLSGYSQKSYVVSGEGKADFKTIQQALDAVPSDNKEPVTVYIKNGVYREKLWLPEGKNYVTLVGEDRFNTVITFDDHTGKTSPAVGLVNTRNSYTFKVSADNFAARNLTVRNDAGFSAGQAVGLHVEGDKAIFLDCRIVGNQDILLAEGNRNRQYFKNCYIEGTTDFIFGSATAWFEKCHIHSRKNSHITAAATPESNNYGYIFYDCQVTGDTVLKKVSLGRPWQPHANVLYAYCYLGPHIMEDGWANWNKSDNYKTARYSEYRNYGPGAGLGKRVAWSRQLSDLEAAKVTLQMVFGTWNPLEDEWRLMEVQR